MKYNAPYGSVDPDAPYVDENMAIDQLGSIPPALAIEGPQREIVEVIRHYLPDETPNDADFTQLRKAIQAGLGGISVGAGGGFNRLLVFGPGTDVWTPPPGVTRIFLQLFGAGGGGGGSTTNSGAGAGGGGGGYWEGYLDVVPGVGINVTVGAGGRGGGEGASGEAGGITYFGTEVLCYGGTGGGGTTGGVGRPIGKAGKVIPPADDQGNPVGLAMPGAFAGTGILTGGNLWAGGVGGGPFGVGYTTIAVGAVGDGQTILFDPEYVVFSPGQGGQGAGRKGFGISGWYGLALVHYQHPEA